MERAILISSEQVQECSNVVSKPLMERGILISSSRSKKH